MGYTHYWGQTRDFTAEEWQQIREDMAAILHVAQIGRGVKLAGGLGKARSRPVIDANKVEFNGVGEGSHETFGFRRNGGGEGSFCKTARKPYDIVVTAALCYLSSVHKAFDVSSDGYGYNFTDGLELAREALPRLANQLDVPMGIMESDRWCGPYPRGTPDGYLFSCCVDGRGYIIRERDGASYAFHSHRELAAWAAGMKEPGKHPDANRRESNGLFNATGSFDKTRHDRIATAQKRLFDEKLREAKADPSRQVKPPLFVRPEARKEGERFSYYFKELLEVEAEDDISSNLAGEMPAMSRNPEYATF